MKIKMILIPGILVLLLASFWMGGYVKQQTYIKSREQRCGTLVSFALGKAENGDILDPGTMKALISNVYAAYQFCDDPVLQTQLHGLWNYLLFEEEDVAEEDAAAVRDILLRELKSVQDAIKKKD